MGPKQPRHMIDMSLSQLWSVISGVLQQRNNVLQGLLRFSLALLSGCQLCATECSIAQILGDHMVLQRGQPLTIWGSAEPGAEVAVSLADHRATTRADAAGAWSATLPAMEASGPHMLEARSGASVASRSDIMLGDVWLASGQSNMVFALASTSEWPTVRSQGRFSAIRICKLPGTHAMAPAEGYGRDVPWQQLDSARDGYFSAVAYHFARTIQPQAGVAIGVIQAASGGTMAEQWTPEAALRADDPQSRTFAARDKALARLAADPAAKVGSAEAGASALYNGTLHPLRHLRFAGALWYQGEANSRSKDDYRPRLITLIRSWRELFGQPALPVIIIQLPDFGLPKDDGWMRVQEAQRLVAGELGLPLVVTIGQGSKVTIHPANKAEIGHRAGLAALQHIYRQPVVGSSPAVRALRFEGAAAVLDFDGDLVATGALSGFELAGPDQAFVPASARIAGRQVTVTADGLPQPVAIRYLWAHAPKAISLAGPTGLPVGPFRFGAGAPQPAP